MPKEYIEREKAIELVKNYGKGAISDGMKTLDPVDDIISIVKGFDLLPTADVVEVVFCKECKHLYCCSAIDREFYCRHIHGMKGALNPIEENPYCSYGERKGAE